MEINYIGPGSEGGFDDIISWQNVLGKHVVVFCTCTNALDKDVNNKLTYCSWAEECFDTWHKRVHILVADNESKDFTRRQELYKASQGDGYVDRALSAFEKGENEVAGKILGKALTDLSTYQFEVVEIDEDISRFYVRTLSPTQEENSLLEDCNISPRLTMWFDMSKSSAKFIKGGKTFGDYVPSFEVNSENIWTLMANGEFK